MFTITDCGDYFNQVELERSKYVDGQLTYQVLKGVLTIVCGKPCKKIKI